jgi:hypothetical protein
MVNFCMNDSYVVLNELGFYCLSLFLLFVDLKLLLLFFFLKQLMILQSSNRQCEVSLFKLYLLSPLTIWHWIRKYLEFGFGKLMCGFPGKIRE